MEAAWILAGLLVGVLAAYFLIKPRLKHAETEAAAERTRANDLDKSRQQVEIEVTALRGASDRVRELTAELDADRSTILDLTQKHAAAAANVANQEKIVDGLKARLDAIIEEAADNREKLSKADKDRSAMSSTIVERELSLQEERKQFADMRAALKAEFAQLSADALKDNGEAFLRTAKEILETERQSGAGELDKRKQEIKELVKPIEDGIKAVSEATRNMETARATAFGTIEEQLRQSVAFASEVAKQAGALKDALKRPNVRGRWGEVQLKICVELAGMEEHCDVEFQETSLSVEDEALRPDMIVRMPGGRKLTVDSKTPMDHFLSYIDASSDDERQTALLNHGKSVKKHVANLAKTDYMQRIAESPDFVVMFLPNESFLAMALEKEPTLMEEALAKKVLIATPGTLIGLLKVVLYGWNEQKIAQNAQRIADEGSRLNDELIKFLGDFAKLSLAIEAVNDAFSESRNRVQNQIAKRSLALRELGAGNRSSLKKGKRVLGAVTEILKAAGADDEDIQQTEDPEQLSLAAVAVDEQIEY